MTFEDEGRFIAIAVMFSLTIVAALAAGLLSLRVGTPFWASFFVAALWFCVALLMLLGVGILQGVHAVSTDTCLYAETFAVHYAGQKVQDPQKSAFLKKAVEYYVVPGSAADANGSAISYLIEFDITPVYALLDVSRAARPLLPPCQSASARCPRTRRSPSLPPPPTPPPRRRAP
jgi:hypothetical protein